MRRGGLFVTGTDTDVGKTVAAACLVKALSADYWKPVQSGTDEGDDSDEVRRLTGMPAARIHPCSYRFKAPLAPDQAARLEGVKIDPHHLVAPVTDRFLVVEGAGGLLVPLHNGFFMIDLIVRLGLPVVLVGRSGLGTINHCLLSLEALRSRDIPVLAVVLNGEPNPANREAIETHGRVHVKDLRRMDPLDAEAVARLAKGWW